MDLGNTLHSGRFSVGFPFLLQEGLDSRVGSGDPQHEQASDSGTGGPRTLTPAPSVCCPQTSHRRGEKQLGQAISGALLRAPAAP